MDPFRFPTEVLPRVSTGSDDVERHDPGCRLLLSDCVLTRKALDGCLTRIVTEGLSRPYEGFIATGSRLLVIRFSYKLVLRSRARL